MDDFTIFQLILQNALTKPCNGVLGCMQSVTAENRRAKSTKAKVEGRYPCWRMWRDVKRRAMVKEYYDTRIRLNALRKNDLLPKSIQVTWFILEQVVLELNHSFSKFDRDSIPLTSVRDFIQRMHQMAQNVLCNEH